VRERAGRPSLRQIRELARKVPSNCAVEVETEVDAYAVPWRHAGRSLIDLPRCQKWVQSA
jgi:hypothetical protein